MDKHDKERILNMFRKSRISAADQLKKEHPEESEVFNSVQNLMENLQTAGYDPEAIGIVLTTLGVIKLFEEGLEDPKQVALKLHRMVEINRATVEMVIMASRFFKSLGEDDQEDVDKELDKWLKKNS